MGNYNFDIIKDRTKTNSLKFDFAIERGKPADIMPLWVADMDFETAPPVIEAMRERLEHGIFGYTFPKTEYRQILIQWMKKRHNWDIKEHWVFQTPGVVFAISLAIKALTEENEGVMLQRPVYYPFFSIVENNNRIVVNNPLVYLEDEMPSYKMDVDDFERKIIENNVKLFILCNPHNPVGRVWTKEELTIIGDICLKHKVLVISDEIHEDFIYEGHQHVVFANIKPEYANITITCTSPSKTFNLAGLQISNIIVSNREIRAAILREMDKTGYDEPNVCGMVACQAAYEKGEEWLEELKQYLAENLSMVRDFVQERMPRVKLIPPEGTYLIWLDFSAYGLSKEALDDHIVNKAKLWLDSGEIFGIEGEGFQRINIATSKENLKRALLQLEKAFV